MSATSDYEAALHARGWYFLQQLPKNTPLGPGVAGAPGGRSPNTASVRSTFELAPLTVRIEQGFTRAIDDFEAGAAAGDLAVVNAITDTLTTITEHLGLDHGIGGLISKTFGIPPYVLLVVAVLFAYAVARQYRIVPPVTELV